MKRALPDGERDLRGRRLAEVAVAVDRMRCAGLRRLRVRLVALADEAEGRGALNRP